ncbi:hypothetical protein HMPREF0620_1114 [Parascardovia denticolens DSM 10105 = JCM 12538]|uniref:Uncharacterized protein n=1 Tax=Parascardovia denticolens DSM 10105 = JCM 12538 TaxID=864564 RepID=E6JZV5_PARDN|nr:hypothetical protein [Parascardovia denticolens]EFG32559.1 hypothetical protein HMPREF9017_01463 [Parascardovia denticolens F0305]EFT84109.1 hypothetical protein HMPREF0620_1114 [Parascardovia denticolens DSM 10105 = JCM 12538]BAR05059.1 hypothetical protein PSDT_0540 [Parascardovia denticolens DSM 10105 = JCM 12538]
MKIKDLISKLNSYDPDLELEDLSELNGYPREEWCFPLLDAEELLRHLDKMLEVKSKYHPAFLDLSYGEFRSRYAIPSGDAVSTRIACGVRTIQTAIGEAASAIWSRSVSSGSHLFL